MERYRTLPRRIAAAFVDLLPILPFLAGSLYLGDLPDNHPAVLAVSLGSYSVSTAYFVIFHALSGQTIGKHLFRVRVVRSEDETQISWRQAVLRELPLILFLLAFSLLETIMVIAEADGVPLWLPTLYLVLDRSHVIWMLGDAFTTLLNSKRRSLHDYIGRTVVVRTDSIRSFHAILSSNLNPG